MKKICIVGYGAIGPIHASAIKKIAGACLYAVCDINPDRIGLCQKNYNVKGYTDFREMLKDEQIDVVHICTPHYLHYEMILQTLKAGKEVVAEKPVVMTREEFDKIRAYPGSDKVCLVFQNRLNTCVQYMKKLVEEKTLGEIQCVRGILTWKRDKAYYQSGAWRGKWATEGGGVLINQAVHTLDLMVYLCGKCVSLKANMTNFSLQDVIEVEDTVSAALRFENGVTGVFFATNAYGANSRVDVEIICEKGTIHYTDDRLFVNDEPVCMDVTVSGEKSYWGSGHEALIRNYYECGKFFSIADAENTMSTLFAIYESAKFDGKEIMR